MGNQMREALKAVGATRSRKQNSKVATPNAGRTAGRMDVQLPPNAVEVVHGSGRDAPPVPAPARATPLQQPPQPCPRLVKKGAFRRPPLFVEDAAERRNLPRIKHSGIAGQLTNSPEDETDLIIGLDFGTSATKVVIRDRLAAVSVFPVALRADRPGIEGFLLPSRIFLTDGVYSLSGGDRRIDDLKLALLACKAVSPVDEFNHCCAYLALVIRRSRGWLLDNHGDIYRKHALNWRVNLGLAARSYREEAKVDLFRRLGWAAANAAADMTADDLDIEVVDRYRRDSIAVFTSSRDSIDEAFEFGKSDVDAVPEVSAQIMGFMTSSRWDWSSRPVMMLVDVGAGTVDSALFHVDVPNDGHGKLTFWASRVESNGVMNLHRGRVAWLQSLLPDGAAHDVPRKYLADIARPTDRIRPIPTSVLDYVPGYQLENVSQDADQCFWIQRYRAQVAGSILDAKVGKGIRSSQLQNVPLLLCGGGSRMPFYSRIREAINETKGWDVSLETMRMPVPRGLASAGWHSEDFDRLSVAYGLSLAGRDESTLGRIVRDIDVPDVLRRTADEREDRFITKDQM